MVTIIVETNWPAESSKKLGEVWLGMPPIPEKMKLLYAGVKGEAAFIRGLVMWQVEDSFVAEALSYLNNDVARYFVVPGYGYTITPWTDAADALKLVGLG
jgi:hypothetical protein